MVFTTLKSIVELVFILPYYMMKSEPITKGFRFFTTQYEFLIFNLSVFADYGILFFSVLIAVNRFFVVIRKTGGSMSTRWTTFLSCLFVWACSIVIPLIFYLCKCQYEYSDDLKTYYNKCDAPPGLSIILLCLLYLSYICCIVVVLLYSGIFLYLRRKRGQNMANSKSSKQSTAEMKLLKQSVVVFLLYAASILSVLILSFIPAQSISISQLSYTENILNLLIAAIYPICILAMSGDMKSVLIAKLSPSKSKSVVVSMVSLNNVRNSVGNNNVVHSSH
ncbi:hypothetical protein PMAYCL1PPCAC_14040, partial [Pristionchus mayeri]